MIRRKEFILLTCAIACIAVLTGVFAYLQTPSVFAQTETGAVVGERRAQLERELAALEKEIDAQQKILEERQNQRVSLERDLAILTAEIKQAQLSIKARNIVIQNLADDIKSKQKTIVVLSDTIDKEKASIAYFLRKKSELESHNIVDALLVGKNIGEYFQDVGAYEEANNSLQDAYEQVDTNKKLTEAEKVALEGKKEEQTDLLAIQKLQQKRLQEQEAEKKKIIEQTKGQEKAYQAILKDKEKNASAIRTELFSLRGSSAIPFEKALEYAKKASAKTGVRPAVILGIITEESNLGQNVGTGTWRVDMKAPRDTEPFLDITKRLGLDPDKMPVSAKPWYGWGGAMGPAQFIPSTWILYEAKITALTGHNPPNPWNPEDAIMASALLMKENGANTQTRAAERLAALRYLAGWTNASKPAYAFYGNDVMRLADKYQKQIDILGL